MDTMPLPVVDSAEYEQMIRERAYELYQARLEAHEAEDPEEDWDAAVAEIETFVTVEPHS
jgi:hypothetical protein